MNSDDGDFGKGLLTGVIFCFLVAIPLLFAFDGATKGDIRREAIKHHAGHYVITNDTERIWVWTGKE